MKSYAKLFFALIFAQACNATTVQVYAPESVSFDQTFVQFTVPDGVGFVRVFIPPQTLETLELPAGTTLAGGTAAYVYNEATGGYDIVPTYLYTGVEVISSGIMTYDVPSGWLLFPSSSSMSPFIALAAGALFAYLLFERFLK